MTTSRRGTLQYASPELLRGEVGAFSDVWALGILLHELLTGQQMFDGLADAEIVTRIVTGSVPISHILPPAYSAIIQGCLARDRHVRWTIDRVQAALQPTALSAPQVPISPAKAVTVQNSSVQSAPVQCSHCGASNSRSGPVCCQCGRSLGEAVDAGYLAVKYGLGRDLLDKGYLTESLRHFQSVAVAAPSYADAAQRIVEIETRLRATSTMRAKLVLKTLFESGVPAGDHPGDRSLEFGVRFASNGSMLSTVFGSYVDSMFIWTLAAKNGKRQVLAGERGFSSASLSPSCQVLATAGGGRIRIWELNSESEVGRVEIHGAEVLSFSEDGTYIIAKGLAEGTVRIHVASLSVETLANPIRESSYEKYTSVLSPTGYNVLYLVNKRLELWDLNAQARISSAAGDNLRTPIALSNSQVAVTLGPDDTLCIHDMRSGSLLKSLQWISTDGYVLRDVKVTALSVHPDGNYLAVSLIDRRHRQATLQVRALDTGKVVWSDSNFADTREFAFSPDGRFLAAMYYQDPHRVNVTVAVWEVAYE